MLSPAVLEAAVEYAERGWSVIPLGDDKRPAVRQWAPAQTRAASPVEVRAWFARVRGARGVGIVLGPVSGDLAVRDFDDADAYSRWALAHPEWANRLPTAKTARGVHVYFRWPGVKTTNFGDGELRGRVAYVVAPPSPHPSGAVYRWVRPPSAEPVPEVDPTAAGLDRAWIEPQPAPPPDVLRHRENRENREYREGGENRDTEDAEDTEDTEAIAAGVLTSKRKEIDAVIRATLPSAFGARNKAVFTLARGLQGIPGLRALPVRAFREVVRRWHQQAEPNILTKDFGTTWGDFVSAWPKVRHPAGDDVLGRALARARAEPDPGWLLALDYAPGHRLLVRLCRELQRDAGERPFFLSARKAGECVGVDFGQAAKWMNALVGDRIVRLITRGTRQSSKASRWNYTGPDLQYPKDLVDCGHGNSDRASSESG